MSGDAAVPKKSDRVARRVVRQALAFNRAKERFVTWDRLRRIAKEEGWEAAEVEREFRRLNRQQRLQQQQQLQRSAPPTIHKLSSLRPSKCTAFAGSVAPLRRARFPQKRNTAQELAERCRILDTSSSVSSSGNEGNADVNVNDEHRDLATKLRRTPYTDTTASNAETVMSVERLRKFHNEALRRELDCKRAKKMKKEERRRLKKEKKKSKKHLKKEKKKEKKRARKAKKDTKILS